MPNPSVGPPPSCMHLLMCVSACLCVSLSLCVCMLSRGSHWLLKGRKTFVCLSSMLPPVCPAQDINKVTLKPAVIQRYPEFDHHHSPLPPEVSPVRPCTCPFCLAQMSILLSAWCCVCGMLFVGVCTFALVCVCVCVFRG